MKYTENGEKNSIKKERVKMRKKRKVSKQRDVAKKMREKVQIKKNRF